VEPGEGFTHFLTLQLPELSDFIPMAQGYWVFTLFSQALLACSEVNNRFTFLVKL
jgi:hypothetical protein